MLTANRFVVVPTKDCRGRLEEALSNQRPIARGEKHRGAVVAIQTALADLNPGYLFPAEIDGYFGSRTCGAVETFQRDYGLIADGIVGRQTMEQLNTLYSNDVLRKPRGLSVHVGVNQVDAKHYGDEFALSSCVNDARKMREIAESLGYDAVTLENEEAKVSNFTGFMRHAISELIDGDSLMVTFSGHGSQIPNNSNDAETDNLDETLCFFDRMLVDDEFYALLGQFRGGVRVHAVFDSCHSGTVGKDPHLQEIEQNAYKDQTLKTLQKDDDKRIGKNQTISADGISKALDGDKPKFADPPKSKGIKLNKDERRSKDEVNEDISTVFADLYAEGVSTTANKKEITEFNLIYKNNKDLYDAIKNVVGPAEDQQLVCSVITLSACQDSQTTPAGRLYSYFTANILSIWKSRGFDGSYRQFHHNLVDVGRPDATPAINTYGSGWAKARLYERPFVF
jgi:metacaspase-1